MQPGSAILVVPRRLNSTASMPRGGCRRHDTPGAMQDPPAGAGRIGAGTPYSRQSYEKNSLKLTARTRTTLGGVAQALVSILGSMSSSMRQGEALSAVNDLAEFSKLMAGKYARGQSLPDRTSIDALLQEAMKVNRWMASDREIEVEDGD